MFPLGTVLFPGMVLPLRIFEPRYREMLSTVLDGDRRFGVVLIERGSEVGGGDVRTSLGVEAEVLQAEQLGPEMWAAVAVGRNRIRVLEWLPDDPYPTARIEEWPEEDAGVTELAAPYEAATGDLRTALALATELGRPAAPVDCELPEDPAAGSHAVAAVAPLGPIDQQRLLAAPGPVERFDLARSLLAEQIGMLRAQIQMGDQPS